MNRCRKAGQPIGKGEGTLSISPDGHAYNVVLVEPYAGSRVGSCIEEAYRNVSFGPFSGKAVAVRIHFEVE